MSSVARFENLKIRQIHTNNIYSCCINYIYINKLILRGVTCITGKYEFLKRTLLFLLSPNKQCIQNYTIITTFYYNNCAIPENKYCHFFQMPIEINKFETVIEVVKYALFFSKKKLLADKLLHDFGLKEFANTKVCNLSDKNKYKVKFICDLVFLPKIMIYSGLDSDDYNFTKVLKRYSQKYNIIIVVPVDSYYPEFECIDKWIHIEHEQMKDRNADFYKIVYNEFCKEQKMLKNSSDDLEEYYTNPTREIDAYNFDNNNNLDFDDKSMDDKQMDQIANERYHCNNERKKYELTSMRRFFCIDNYSINSRVLKFMIKRKIMQNYKIGDKYFILVIFIVFDFIANYFMKTDTFLFNFARSTYIIKKTVKKLFHCAFKNPKTTLPYCKAMLKLMLENFVYPIFSDFKINDIHQTEQIVMATNKLLFYKIRTTLIYVFIFEGALNASKFELETVVHNINVYFLPGTYLLSIFGYLIATHWLPIILTSAFFFGQLPLLNLFTASYLSLILVAIRHFSYKCTKNEYTALFVAFFFIYLIWVEPNACTNPWYSILYYSRKLNPVFIAKYFFFLTGKPKWRYVGYCIRSFLMIYVFCIYHISKT
ncbi:hypothetical protein BDAP_001350 [Binucleata daphniae]